MQQTYRTFRIRSWQPSDREAAAEVIRTALAEYGLGWEPTGADRDVLQIETAYWAKGGQFWVIEQAGEIVGTAAFYPIDRGDHAVEIRKMYLRADVRGQGLGRYLLTQLEQTIAAEGYHQIWVETASILREAVLLYEKSGYQPGTEVETDRCDRVYFKQIIRL